MGSPGPRRTGRRSTPIDSTLPRPHPTAAPTLRSRSARASSRTLRELPPGYRRLAGRRAEGTGRRRMDRDVHLEGAIESIPDLLFRLTDEIGDAFREDRGGDRTSAQAFQELRQTQSDATSLEAHPVQGQGPRTRRDRSLDESFSIPPARQILPICRGPPETSREGLGQRSDRGLRGGEDNIDVDSRPVRPSYHVVCDRLDERRGAGDRLDGEEALRVIPVRVGRIQEMARLGEGSRVHENPVERTARECPGNEANRIRGGLHGPDSHYADGDSHPSPFASAWGAVSAQLSTYEGSRWTNPYVVIRMLSKYVSSITASRPCTFPRAARERSAALPCGLCGVEPGWNVKDPSSTTPSRAP